MRARHPNSRDRTPPDARRPRPDSRRRDRPHNARARSSGDRARPRAPPRRRAGAGTRCRARCRRIRPCRRRAPGAADRGRGRAVHSARPHPRSARPPRRPRSRRDNRRGSNRRAPVSGPPLGPGRAEPNSSPKASPDRLSAAIRLREGVTVFRPPRCTDLASLPAPADLDPAGALERLRDAGAPWLLESALTMPGVGRFSFAGADPYLIARCRGRDVEIECRRAVYEGLTVGTSHHRAPALPALRALLPAPPRERSELPFCGGAVGVFGYELAQQLDVHRFSGADDLALPDATWLFVDALIGFDHERGRAEILGLGVAHEPSTARERAERAARDLARRLAGPASRAQRAAGERRPSGGHARPALHPAPSGAHSELGVSAYRKAVEAIAEQIAAGELYQACLTYRIDRAFAGDPWRLYRALRRCDPAPFAAYLELPEIAIVGSSPERFLR